MRYFQSIVNLGVDADDGSLQSRSIKLCNQANIFIGVIMLLLFVFLRVMGFIEGESMGMGSLRVLIVLTLAIINLILTKYGWTRLVKVITIFVVPFVILLFPTFFGFVEAESFTYYPIVVIAFSVMPHLLIAPKVNRYLYFFSILYFVLLIAFIDSILFLFLDDALVIVEEIKTFYPYYKMGQIASFVFIQLSVLYLRFMNSQYESSLEITNEELVKSTDRLLLKNTALVKARAELADTNEELVSTQEQLTNQNQQLTNTLSELKAAHARLVQAEKLAALGTLTAGVAHEINNPLNYIAGGIGLLDAELEYVEKQGLENISVEDYGNLVDVVKRALFMMNSGVGKASAIVKSLGVYSYAGKTELKSIEIDSIFDSSLRFLTAKIDGDIVIEKDLKLGRKVPVHLNKMHQVLLNILDNSIFAVKKSEGKKLIRISTDVAETKSVEYAELRIENSGPQIPEQILKNIFDPFYTTKNVGEGTGLGLSISQTLIKEHKGEIEVVNSAMGVCYIIRIPL